MFDKILHASDGSKHAFHALTLALAIAKQNNSELHMVWCRNPLYAGVHRGSSRGHGIGRRSNPWGFPG